MSSPGVEATPPPRPPPPQRTRLSMEDSRDKAKRRLSGDFTTATPPMSESRRRSQSMSSRPSPKRRPVSPPHTKPKPSRPPPPSNKPSTQSRLAGSKAASLPRGVQPSSVTTQGGRPHSKSSGNVHAVKVQESKDMMDGFGEQPASVNGVHTPVSVPADTSNGTNDQDIDPGAEVLSTNDHSGSNGAPKSAEKPLREQVSPRKSPPGIPPSKPPRKSPSHSPKMVPKKNGTEEPRPNGQSKPSMGNGTVIPDKPSSGVDTDTPSGIANGSGPNGQPGNVPQPPDQAVVDQSSSSNGHQKLTPSQSKPEADKTKDSRANAVKPIIPPRPYRPPRPFPPPTKQGTRSPHRTPPHAPLSQDVPQSTPTPPEDTPSKPEDKESHDHPAESQDSRAAQADEKGTAADEEEKGEGEEGESHGAGTAKVLYQPKTLFDETTAQQDETPPQEHSSKGRKLLKSMKKSFRSLRGRRRHTDTSTASSRRQEQEEGANHTPIVRRHTDTALFETLEEETKGMDEATFKRNYPDPLPQGVIHPLVILCVAYLNRESVLKETGLFRVPGDIASIRKLRADFIKGAEVDLSKVLDPHTITGLIKVHFREQRVSLIPRGQPLASILLAVKQQDVEGVRGVLQRIDVNHTATLRLLTEVLSKVAEYSDYNYMTSGTIAASTGPSILPYLPPSNANVLLKFLIDHCSEVFQQ